MTLLIKTNADRWTRMIRATGVVGLVSVVLLFAPIIAISSLGEPSFLASAGEARAFFINGNATWAQAASVLASVGDRPDLVCHRAVLVARPARGKPTVAVVALVSGIMLPAYLLLDVS